MVIVLAAGRGERFAASGGSAHKLQALLGGRSVIDHVMDAVTASGLPFHVVHAAPSRPGMGDSIAAGVRATPDAAGWLILPADLPLVNASTLLTIAAPSSMAVTVPVHKGQRGHPVRFGPVCGPALLRLEGSSGAASILKAQMAAGTVEFIDVDDAGVVTDIDTLDDLQRAEVLLKQRLV